MNSKKRYIFTIVITALVTCLATNVVRDVTYVTNEGRSLRKISAVKKMLSNYSLFDIDEEKVADYASMAMAAAIDDPYTAYYPKEDFSSYKSNIMSTYVGIGATLGADIESDRLVVVSPMEDSPAEKSGIRSGDIITAIDGKQFGANQLSEAATYLKNGEEGTDVALTLNREGTGQFDVTVTRSEIIKISVKSKMLSDNIGYVRITGFESKGTAKSNSTYDEFREHMSALQSAGMERLIIDLRDNPGGDLNVVCDIADMLLPKGIITYTEDKHGKRTTMNSDSNEVDMPMAVLVNGGSASASEILTGALKDYKKATVIGTKTYGKGIVQTVYPFTDGSGISITTAKYYTPSGVCIHQIGIEPDITVEMNTNKAISELELSEDTQLQKAIETVLN
ncbi:MAG: S41 family peptidase [Clostridiales bacterium]|nr:S41 family peptidase [Clostridiales bacterium]